MKKRSLAALAAGMLISIGAIGAGLIGNEQYMQ